MRPPVDDWATLVARIICDRPGIRFDTLAVETSIWPDDLARITRALRDAGVIELREDGKLWPRERKRKRPEPPLPAPSFWARLGAGSQTPSTASPPHRRLAPLTRLGGERKLSSLV